MNKQSMLVVTLTALVIGCSSDSDGLLSNTLNYDGNQTVLTKLYVRDSTRRGDSFGSGSIALIPETINLEEETGHGWFLVLDIRLPKGQAVIEGDFPYASDEARPNSFAGDLIHLGSDDAVTEMEGHGGTLEINFRAEDLIMSVSGTLEFENGKRASFNYEGTPIRTNLFF